MNKQRQPGALDKLIEYSFYLLAAAVTFSNLFTEMATAIIILSWIMAKVLRKDLTLPGGKLSFVLAVFVIWNLLSFINTAYIDESIRGLFKVIKHALLFFAAVDYFRSKQRLKKLFLFSLGVGFIISLNGIAQYITGADPIRQRAIDVKDYLYRVSSSFRHSNDFGGYLIVLIAIQMGLFFSRIRPLKQRILLLLVILPAGWCLMATSSRGAWIGFVIAMLCLGIIRSKKLLAVFLILLVISPFFLPGSIKDRFCDLSRITKEGSGWERVKLWSGTLAMAKDYPFLGVGVNTYTRNFPEYKPKDYPDIRYTHNSYLQMASEIGFVGAGIFLVFLAGLLISAGRAVKRFKKGLNRDLALGLFAGTTGFLAQSAVDTHFYSVTLSAFMFLCLGLLVAFRNLADEEEP